jgi:hypothetical protein
MTIGDDTVDRPIEDATKVSIADSHREMAAAFASAALEHADDLAVMHLRFAEMPVVLRATDPDLLWDISAAFRHLVDLPDDDNPPILNIDVWESEDEPSPYPRLPFARASNRYFYYRCDDYKGSLDLKSGQMLICVQRRTNTFFAHPFRRMLWRWYAGQEVFPLQGALVAHKGSAIFVCGERGSGRSSAVVECVQAGWDFLADSQAGVSRSGDLFTGYCLFACIKLEPSHAGSYHEWQPFRRAAYAPPIGHDIDEVQLRGNEETVFNVADAYPERIVEKAPIRAIVVLMENPDRDGPATARLAQRAATSAMMTDPRGLDRSTLKRGKRDYLKLANSCPCFAIVRRSISDPLMPSLEKILREL